MAEAARDQADGRLADDPERVPIRSSELVHAGRVWDLRRDAFEYGGEVLERDYLDHPGAVAVLALDEAGRVALIKQYRHPVRARDWELPAGLLDVPGEDPLAAAQRELAEEADLVAGSWHVLADFFTSPGGSDESIRIYLARELRDAPEVFARDAEEADIELRLVGLDEVVDGVLDRRLHNPLVAVGALAAHIARARGWASLAPADAEWPFRSEPRRSGA